ncbi:DUF4169 family protein [Stappia taiwanensis]|uniref:DUF4169 family protein n=1 Tax=Stappia taiwanensis TaxID=992267 RepID=A0A838XMM0_9HYPH|nr:DUF4169 family protein [Stappia taiwanensis]MBA4611067.1 DUF4169 family protein [Stappia taiwanensis]GGE85673.1 hypothetical protein GCM10007285_11570 [Stappia taiwanensis]
MTGDIVNLRQARKTRKRAEKTAKAAENRTRFGRTRAERARDALEEGRATARLDGLRRERPDAPDEA